MDLGPTQVMRLLQLAEAFAGDPERAEQYTRRALSADTPWLCVGCEACTTRCPQGVDLAETMDVLRQEALRRGLASQSARAKAVQALHRTFMDGVWVWGRVHELSLVAFYKLRTLNLLQDAMLGPAMYLKGKLHLLPPRRQPTAQVRRAVEALQRRRERGCPHPPHEADADIRAPAGEHKGP
jgi:heterodisulfide reductase subunit C